MNVKLFERLGYVNVEYGDALESFFDTLANEMLQSDQISMLDSSETQPTLSEGKVSKKLPGLGKFNLLKLLAFIGLYLMRLPIHLVKQLLWCYRNRLNERFLRVVIIVNYYLKVAEFSGFFCFILGSLFESSIGFLLLSHQARILDWRFKIGMSLGVAFALFYLIEVYYYLIVVIKEVNEAEEQGKGLFEQYNKSNKIEKIEPA